MFEEFEVEVRQRSFSPVNVSKHQTLLNFISSFDMSSKYTHNSTIAAALYGDISTCTDTTTNESLIMKRIQLQYAQHHITTRGLSVHEDMDMEIHVNVVLSSICHPHLVQMRDHYIHEDAMHLILEHCTGGDLFDVVHAGALPLEKGLRYFQEIVSAVHTVHTAGFAHRDLSLENVFMTSDDHCKLADFGLAISTDARPLDIVGKPFYIAPEVFSEGVQYDPVRADMWSLGIILYILLTGAPPMASPSLNDPSYDYLRKYGMSRLCEARGFHFPAAIMKVLDGLVEINPETRWDMKDLLSHNAACNALPQKRRTLVKVKSFLSLKGHGLPEHVGRICTF